MVLHSTGIAHGSFSDYSLLTAGDNEAAIHSAEHNLSLIESFIRAFLDKNLKHEKAPLLDGPGPPTIEAIIQRYGH